MATRRLPSVELILVLLLTLFPRLALLRDNGYLKQKSQQPSENTSGQAVLTAGFEHEQTVKSTPDIPHVLSSHNMERLFTGAERIWQQVNRRGSQVEHLKHVSDTEKLGKGTALMGIEIWEGEENIKARLARDTEHSIGTKMSPRWLQNKRQPSNQRHHRYRQQHISSGSLTTARVHSPQQPNVIRKPVIQVGNRTKESREDRLARLRLIWQRYRRRKPTRRRPSQSATNRSRSTVGLAISTNAPRESPIDSTTETHFQTPRPNFVENTEGLHNNTLSSHGVKFGPATQHQGKSTSLGPSAAPTKLVSETTTRITSDMTTLNPFIDSTKAFDYLSSFSSRPIPRRWPLKVVREERVLSSPVPSGTEHTTHKQFRNISGSPATSAMPRNMTLGYNQNNSSVSTTEIPPQSTPHRVADSPTDYTNSSPTYRGVSRVSTMSTHTAGKLYRSSNSKSRMIAGGSLLRKYVNHEHVTSMPQTPEDNPSYVKSLGKEQNVSISRERSVENKTLSGILEAQDSQSYFTTADGSGDERSHELASVTDDNILTTTRTSLRHRKQKLWRANRQRKAKNQRKGKKAGRKRKKTRSRSRVSKNRAARRALRRRRRKHQRLRRKKLKLTRKNRKRRVKNRTRLENQELPDFEQSKSTPWPQKSQTVVTPSYLPRTPLKAVNSTGRNNVSHSHVIMGARNLSNIFFQQTLQNKTDMTVLLVNLTLSPVNMTASPMNRTVSSAKMTRPSVHMTGSPENMTVSPIKPIHVTKRPTPGISVDVSKDFKSPTLVPNTEASNVRTNPGLTAESFQGGGKFSLASQAPDGMVSTHFVHASTNVPDVVKHSVHSSTNVPDVVKHSVHASTNVPDVVKHSVHSSTNVPDVVKVSTVKSTRMIFSPASMIPHLFPSPQPSLQSAVTTQSPKVLPIGERTRSEITTQTSNQNYRSTLESDQQLLSNTVTFPSVQQRASDDNIQDRETSGKQKSHSSQQPIREPSTPMASPRSQESQSGDTSPFVGYKTAYDFLSNQNIHRNRHHNEERREMREYHRAISERLCKVFKKKFVPTSIGGRCV